MKIQFSEQEVERIVLDYVNRTHNVNLNTVTINHYTRTLTCSAW